MALLVVGVSVVRQARDARDHLQGARAELSTTRAALLDGDFDVALDHLARAGADTRAARAAVDGPVWDILGSIPAVGSTFKTAQGLAAAADDIARGVLPEAAGAAQAVDPDRIRRPDGSVDLALLADTAPLLMRAHERSSAVADRVALLPAGWLAPQVADAREELVDETADLRGTLRNAADAVASAPALLGGDRPRRYLVIAQQTGESRGTGGLPGGYAALAVSDGRFTVLASGSNRDFVDGRIPPPPGVPQDWVDRYEPRGGLSLWSNANFSPDLPVVARVFAARWERQGGGPVDGVVMVDARALALILAGTPPLVFADGTSLPSAEIEQFLAVEQYRGLSPDNNGQRKERLEEVARAALDTVVADTGNNAAVLRGVVAAVRSGHLRVASDDPELAAVLRRTGVDGALPEGPAPVAYPVVWNGVGEKLDHWLSRRIRYQADGCSTTYRRSRIETTLRSDPPPDLPPYLTISIQDGVYLQSRTSRVTLNVYGTRGAALERATLDGTPVSTVLGRTETLLTAGTEAGLPVWGITLDLPPGQERTFVLELVEPTTAGVARVPEQPLSRDLEKRVEVPVC